MGKHRKKRRTHVREATEQERLGADPNKAKLPKSFVIRSGKIGRSATELVQNIRKTMEPHTASRLRERNTNRLKDFVAVAGPLGVTHAIIVSQTEISTNIRFARLPRGPTLTFKVSSYALMKDIAFELPNPKSLGLEFTTPPILIMNNFSGEEKHHKLMLTFFQNLFPPLDVANMKLSEARRVLLLSYNRETNSVEFRHYDIHFKVTGVSKSIKKILQANIPDLENLEDVSEFILNNEGISDSEAEDNGETKVTLEQNYVGKNKQSSQRRVTLIEIGPRMTMQLTKIQDGFCDGQVLYHLFVKKTEEEKKKLKRRREDKEKLKEERRKAQEENIKKKKVKLEKGTDHGEEDEENDEYSDFSEDQSGFNEAEDIFSDDEEGCESLDDDEEDNE